MSAWVYPRVTLFCFSCFAKWSISSGPSYPVTPQDLVHSIGVDSTWIMRGPLQVALHSDPVWPSGCKVSRPTWSIRPTPTWDPQYATPSQSSYGSRHGDVPNTSEPGPSAGPIPGPAGDPWELSQLQGSTQPGSCPPVPSPLPGEGGKTKSGYGVEWECLLGIPLEMQFAVLTSNSVYLLLDHTLGVEIVRIFTRLCQTFCPLLFIPLEPSLTATLTPTVWWHQETFLHLVAYTALNFCNGITDLHIYSLCSGYLQL